MQKQTLDKVSELQAHNSIGRPNEGESFEEYVQRMYPQFEQSVIESENPVVSEIAKDSKDPLKNAVSKVSVRIRLVEQFCAVNDPFELEPPKEATTAEILEMNGLKADEETLRNAMGDEQFEDYLEGLKKPKNEGKTKTEINELRIQHYAQYEPCFPSQKEYNHNSGGTTRGYHWQGDIQDLYLEDHVDFLVAYDLEDSFPVTETETDESE